MSAAESPRNMLGETKHLEAALRFLAKNPDKQLSFIAGKFQVQPTDLWAWLGQFNGGKKDLSETRLNSVLAQAGEQPAAAAEDAPVYGDGPKPGRAPRKPREDSARNDDPAPWLKRGTKPRANGVATHRATILGITQDKEPKQTGGWQQFSRKWFGTTTPSAAQAKAFLAWIDDVPAEKPAKVAKPKKEKKARKPKAERQPRAKKKAKRKYTRRLMSEADVAQLPDDVQPPPIPAAAPVGLRPRWLADEQRMQEVASAVRRYAGSGLTVPLEWTVELAELVCGAASRRPGSQTEVRHE